jgi:hypothetical protein
LDHLVIRAVQEHQVALERLAVQDPVELLEQLEILGRLGLQESKDLRAHKELQVTLDPKDL